jgi:hypothetical protein
MPKPSDLVASFINVIDTRGGGLVSGCRPRADCASGPQYRASRPDRTASLLNAVCTASVDDLT